MRYPDHEFYCTVFCGSEEEEVIMPFIRAAGDILRGYISTEVSEEQEAVLFRAVCAQAEYMKENEGFSSVKLGDISAEFYKSSALCPRAAALLEVAGLLFRGDVILGR